jgi:L-threonylcarbamoyladenylate synthase
MSRQKVNILPVDSVTPDKATIHRAASILKKGGVVVFPTRSFYGLGAGAFHVDGVSRIFEVKKRDPHKPLLILIASESDLDSLVEEIPPVAKRLMQTFWPGKITLVFNARPIVPEKLTGGTNKIGIRVATHPVSRELLRACAFPITGTSANLSGQGGCISIDALDEKLAASVDCILDAGPLAGIAVSTVVDVTVFPPKILREGVVSAKDVMAACPLS